MRVLWRPVLAPQWHCTTIAQAHQQQQGHSRCLHLRMLHRNTVVCWLHESGIGTSIPVSTGHMNLDSGCLITLQNEVHALGRLLVMGRPRVLEYF
jgi:hypothetical protein